MPSITRTKSETVVTVTATNRKIRVSAEKELTIEESRELRGLLKKQERIAEGQSASIWGNLVGGIDLGRYSYNPIR